MIRPVRVVSFMLILLAVLSGCATGTGRPQTRGDFVSAMKSGRLFTNVEKVVANRPVKAVVADVTDYAKRCLNVRATSGPSYQYKSAGGSTTYHPKIESIRNGAVALSVQEEYNDRPQSGAPPGGIFVVVAEIHGAGNNKTRVDIYYLSSRGKIVDPLKQWINGDKRQCPSLKRML